MDTWLPLKPISLPKHNEDGNSLPISPKRSMATAKSSNVFKILHNSLLSMPRDIAPFAVDSEFKIECECWDDAAYIGKLTAVRAIRVVVWPNMKIKMWLLIPRRRGSLVKGQCLGNLGGKEMTLTALLRCGGVDPNHHEFYGWIHSENQPTIDWGK